MKLLKVIAGLFLVFLYHIPRLIWHLLFLSYSTAFNNQENLTADPKEHLRRAHRLLRKNKNSLICYAALELRFALERMTHNQLALSSKVSKNTLKKIDPVVKRKALSALDKEADQKQNIYFINKETGERFHWGTYTPLDESRVKIIEGKLGNLLHMKTGLFLGISDNDWYKETRNFLYESMNYLQENLKGNENLFSYEDVENFEIERA